MMLHIVKASAFGRMFKLFEKDGLTPMDISNRTVSVIVKKNKGDDDSLAILPRLDFVNQQSNELVVSWDAELTKGLVEGFYYFGIKLYTIDGKDREIYNSQIEVVKGVFNG